MIILAVGTLLTALLNFATQFMLAKHMSPSDFGIFSSAFYLTMTVAPLCGFGIPQFWLKAFGSEGWGGVRFIIPGLTFTLFTTSIIIVILSGWFLYTEYYHQKLLFLLSFIVLSQFKKRHTMFLSKLSLFISYQSATNFGTLTFSGSSSCPIKNVR